MARGVRIVAAVTSALVAGCGGAGKEAEAPELIDATAIDTAVAPERIDANALYTSGEYLAWKVKWKGLAGGSAKLIVGEPGVQGGRQALVVRSVMETEGLVAVFKHRRDELTTTLDLSSGKPVSSHNLIESGKSRRSIDVTYGDSTFTFEHREAGETQRATQVVPENAWPLNLHATLGHVRAWKGGVGSRGVFYMQSARTLFRVELANVGTEHVDTPAGRYKSVRYEGVAKVLARDGSPGTGQRKLTMWLSDDERRLPVKLVGETQYGDVYAVLTDARRPTGPAR